MDCLFFAVFLIFQAFVLVRSSATVEFKFQRWSNPDHSGLAGDCCDPGWNCGSCDNYFIVCLDDLPGSGDFNDCGIKSTRTDVVFDDNDEFDFPSTIPNNIANPQTIRVASWEGGMRVKLQVWDKDSNSDSKIEETFEDIAQNSSAAQSSAQWVTYTMGTHSHFFFQVRVYCNANYYTSDCSEYCVPTDDQNGHYTCDTITGAKICLDGWEGVLCNQVIKVLTSTTALAPNSTVLRTMNTWAPTALALKSTVLGTRSTQAAFVVTTQISLTENISWVSNHWYTFPVLFLVTVVVVTGGLIIRFKRNKKSAVVGRGESDKTQIQVDADDATCLRSAYKVGNQAVTDEHDSSVFCEVDSEVHAVAYRVKSDGVPVSVDAVFEVCPPEGGDEPVYEMTL